MSFGSFGTSPDDVLETDFYSFFHFGEVKQIADESGATTASYRTAGGFRELVAFEVAHAGGRLDWLSLRIARTFIDDRRDGIFARDIVASFIRENTANLADEGGLASLQSDLLHRPLQRRDEVSYTDSNPLPPWPHLPDDFRGAFAVYRGSEATFWTRLPDTEWSMSNDRFDGVGALTVSFRRWGPVRPCGLIEGTDGR